jgi:hypothetical protein
MVPVTVPLDVKNTGHIGMRLQVQLKDIHRLINIDAVR